ncbi:tyrosine-type recombinase/integrase [Lacticaseibacillus sharpeae]|uniref:Integrase n=1 Tax=Lacticaseibacillus sharpeae JCM 1186 = DSM 20505 TaxID=1291052 RepID=A0A0R1ZHY6_9LACO|nr:site-specific integrase [Lacticaseibacillus sharpeae]KRM54592.1 integrase [Lacticaseibacillus sharpeae JCM 1186 = DSM 20505]
MTIYKRKNRASKPWVFEWTEKDADGKPHKRTKSFDKKEDAKQAEAHYMVDTTGEMPNNPDMTFVDYFELWLDTYKKPVVSAVTMTKYATSQNIIAGYWKQTKLRDITRTKYQKFMNWYIDDGFGHKHSKQSVEKLHSHAHQCLLSALDDNYLRKDPAVRAVLGGTEGKSENDKFLEADDFEKLRDYANHFADETRIGLSMVQFAIYTGARVAEVQGISWHDIDEKAGTVSINKTFNYRTWRPEKNERGEVIWDKPDRVFLPTKNHETRVLDISPVLMHSLHKLMLRAKISAKTNPYGLLFIGPDGTPPTDNDANKEMRRAMQRIGIYEGKELFSFHGLRHSHGSYLLSRGVDVQYVSKRLGHKNLAITLKVYAHVLDRLKRTEAKKAVSVL